MNLTFLRRLVVVANLVALGFSGWAGWATVRDRPRPRDEKEWPRLFPVKPAVQAGLEQGGPAPKDEYTGAIRYAEGEKPVKAGPEAAAPPPPDPFKTKYRLTWVIESDRSRMDSTAQIQVAGSPTDRPFSVRVGTRLPEDPFSDKSALTPWRLDDVSSGGKDPEGKSILPSRAVFHHVETGEEQVLESAVQMGSLQSGMPTGPGDGGPVLPGPFRNAGGGAGPSPDQPPQFRLVNRDPANPEWEVSDDELDWLGVYSDEEAKKIATLSGSDGITVKAVPKGSRAEAVGLKAEDRIISVNDEKVSSVEQAVSVGKRQYDGGTNTFSVKVLRAGKEHNFTFHAPKKKRGADK
jgi:hypothetical protein